MEAGDRSRRRDLNRARPDLNRQSTESMTFDMQILGNVLGIVFALWYLLYAGTGAMRRLSETYPVPAGLRVEHVGLYPYSSKLVRGWIRVGVNAEGLALSQILIPWVLHVRAFIPWADTILMEEDKRVRIGSAKVPDFDLPLRKVVLDTMQSRLSRPLPFGNRM